MVVVGLASGMAAAAALNHLMRSLVFGVETTDAVVCLLVRTLAACLLPARGAAAVDPVRALRQE